MMYKGREREKKNANVQGNLVAATAVLPGYGKME